MRRVPLPSALERPQRPLIEPIFLPFAGCKARCVFCGQEAQTGQDRAPVSRHLEKAAERLADLERQGGPARELAFYGGTFTALAEEDFSACLKFVQYWRERGVIQTARCSTRPDAVDSGRLLALKRAGFAVVELGAQSFDDAALALCGRPYVAADIERAVALVRAAGLEPGIQLLPGMPGVGPERFLTDVERALQLSPACLRFYPCLVIQGTPLAGWWKSGKFAPWALETTVDTLAQGLVAAWRAEAPVIRIGLAPEPEFGQAVLAGPVHPALGQAVMARALLLHVQDWLAGSGNDCLPEGESLELPGHLQGMFFGQKNNLISSYAALGIRPDRILWARKPLDSCAGPE